MTKNKIYSDTTSYKLYSKEVNTFSKMTTKREKEIKKLMLDPNTSEEEKSKLNNEIIEGYLKLVLYIANKHIGLGMDLEDLIAEGNLALIKAIKSFDWSKDNKFITYATSSIRGEILNALNNNSRIIRLPMNVMHQLSKEYKEFNNKGIEISDEIVNLPSTINLYKTISEDSSLIDIIKNNNATQADYDFEFDNLVDYLLSRLDERSAKVIVSLYGLKGYQKDIKTIAEEMNLNIETIRNIKNRALEKLDKRIKLTLLN